MKTYSKEKPWIIFFASVGLIFAAISKPMKSIKEFFARWLTPSIQKYIFFSLLGALIMIVLVRIETPEIKTSFVEVPVEVEIRVPVYIHDSQTVTKEINEEAANIARVLYGVKDYQLTDNAKRAIIEVIFSRVECTFGEFGDTINEVCLKKSQWQGFVEGSGYLQTDYDLALSCINDTTGARVSPEGCYWVVISSDGVTVRNKFEGGNAWTIN